MLLDALVDNLFKSALLNKEVYLELKHIFGNTSVYKAQILGNGVVEDDFTDCGVHKRTAHLAVDFHFAANLNLGVKLDNTGLVRHHNLVDVAEHLALALFAVLVKSKVVRAEDHILGRNGNRLAV